jgi:hypothetical protein
MGPAKVVHPAVAKPELLNLPGGIFAVNYFSQIIQL